MTLNGNKVSGWTFDQNNVLNFEQQAGFSAWLQFTVLPGGPLFMGTMAPSNAEGYVSDKEFQASIHVFCSHGSYVGPVIIAPGLTLIGILPGNDEHPGLHAREKTCTNSGSARAHRAG